MIDQTPQPWEQFIKRLEKWQERGNDREVLNMVRDQVAADAARLQQQEQEIVGMRRWMWLNHGCKASVLYGDDGEMQCNAVTAHPGCRPLDFKRDDLPSLVVAVANGAELKAEADNAVLRAQVETLTRELAAPEVVSYLKERERANKAEADLSTLRDQLAQQTKEIALICRGFRSEAMNGVICTPPRDEHGFPRWDAPPSREWCPECRDRWQRLFTLAPPVLASPDTETK